jgi:hypothetical protein
MLALAVHAVKLDATVTQQLQQLVQGLMTEKEGADKAANAATAAAAEAKAREEDAKRTTEQVHYTKLHKTMSIL